MRKFYFIFFLFICYANAFGQCGWAGDMNYPAGPINQGGTYEVYVQVWQNGVTNSGGQGANINCYVYSGSVTNFGGSWSNVQTSQMNYHSDSGNNDVYVLNIGPSLPQGLYEYTCYCTCNSAAQFWVGGANAQLTVNAPLPVKYQNFDVIRKSSVNYLHWTTASETNNEYFEVQHSTDGRQFEAVGQVKGYGNSNTERDYYFSHEVSGTAISYYRLKQVDFDGKYEYSGIISVRSENDRWDESIAVSPNPVADFLLVTGISEQADYMITDYSGRQLMTGSVVSGQGLDVSTLSSGFYTLILQEGAQKSAHKWIKK